MLDRNFVLSLTLAFVLIFAYNAYYQMRFGGYLEQAGKEKILASQQKANEEKRQEQEGAEVQTPAQAPESANAQQMEAQPPAKAQAGQPPMAVAPELVPSAASLEDRPSSADNIVVDTGAATITLSTQGAVITSYKLDHYHDAGGKPVDLVMDEKEFARKQQEELAKAREKGQEAEFAMVQPIPSMGLKFPREDYSRKINGAVFSVDTAGRKIDVGQTGPVSLRFEYADDTGIVVRKTYQFRPNEYLFDVSTEVISTPQWGDFSYSLVWFGLRDDEPEQMQYLSYHRPILKIGKIFAMDDPDEKKRSREYKGAIKWAALTHKYYAMISMPADAGDSVVRANYIDDRNTTLEWEFQTGKVNGLTMFLGPKRHDALNALGDDQKVIIDYGWFNVVAQPLFWLLDKLHSMTGNWGWAIMLLTVSVKLALFPLSQKAFRSMKRLQKLQPQMKKIQDLYKNDKEKMNQELMAFYKENKVNPMGGCLPMFLQIPIFFALYKVLYESIELKGVPWILWIADLTQKDPYYVTPILMGATMFLQQWMTPSTGDPTQRQIMLIMPVVFTFMFLSFPSGLILYWLVNNVLSIIQQWIINRESFEDEVKNAKPA